MRPYDPETVVLGVVGRPHGVHGEIWLRPHNVLGRSFEGLRELLLVKGGVTTTHAIVALKSTPDGALARLAGIDTREAAAALTLSEVRARRSALPALDPGEFYVDDVIGCDVFHEDGRALGVVASTYWNGAQDVMIVKGPDAKAPDVEAKAPDVEAKAPDGEAKTPDGEAKAPDVEAKAPDGEAATVEQLIPLIPQFVVSVDVPGRKVVVSWDGHD